MYTFEQDLALNNLQGLMCHKTQPTKQSIKFLVFVFYQAFLSLLKSFVYSFQFLRVSF